MIERGRTGQTERDMTQGSAAKKAKCGRTQIVRTSDHVPSHKIDQSEVLYARSHTYDFGDDRDLALHGSAALAGRLNHAI